MPAYVGEKLFPFLRVLCALGGKNFGSGKDVSDREK